MKLEIKHLTPYLPYGLMAEMLDYKRDYVGRKYDEIIGVHQWSKNKDWCLLTDGGSKPALDSIKPILRPLSDLTKEIEHNGEKFVPIEWLFNNLVDATDVIEFEFGSNETPIFQIDDGWNHCISFKNDYGRDLCFSFDSNSNSFMLGLGWENEFGVEWCNISNQYEMFQKLFEWHFDLFRLIENNLAVNINTITK